MAHEVRFESFLPKVAHRVTAVYSIKTAGEADAKVLVHFIDDFLGRCRVHPIESPDPVRFARVNEALLGHIGRLSIIIALHTKSLDEIRRLGEGPLVVINSENTPEDSLERVIERLQRAADTKPPMGFRKQ